MLSSSNRLPKSVTGKKHLKYTSTLKTSHVNGKIHYVSIDTFVFLRRGDDLVAFYFDT